MTEPISLAQARADREQNAKLWSPLECLKATIRDIEAGVIAPTSLYISMATSENGCTRFSYACAGLSRLEAIGLLSQQLHDVMSD